MLTEIKVERPVKPEYTAKVYVPAEDVKQIQQLCSDKRHEVPCQLPCLGCKIDGCKND